VKTSSDTVDSKVLEIALEFIFWFLATAFLIKFRVLPEDLSNTEQDHKGPHLARTDVRWAATALLTVGCFQV